MTQAMTNEAVKTRLLRDPEKETLLCTTGSSRLQRYLDKGKLSKGFAVLSDQTLYFFGKHYRGAGRQLRRQKGAAYLPLSEITRAGYLHKRSTVLLILCFFFLLLAPVMLLLELTTKLQEHTVLTPLLDAVLCLLFAGVSFLFYGCSKKKLLVVHKQHEEYAMDTLYFTEKEERELLRQLHAQANQ